MPSYGQISRLSLLSVNEARSGGQVSGMAALVVAGPPDSRYSHVSRLVANVAINESLQMGLVSSVTALVVYFTEERDVYNSRAWGFTLDEHQLYVLTLGQQGTYVYDIKTQQWHKWQTAGYSGWNFEYGVEWDGQVVGGDNSSGTLWKLDYASFLDEDFKPITRVVTGGFPATHRESFDLGIFTLRARPEKSSFDAADAPTVQLSVSRDQSETFVERETLSITGAASQDLSWRGMGQVRYPGVVFKITDSGGLVTLYGADVDKDGK